MKRMFVLAFAMAIAVVMADHAPCPSAPEVRVPSGSACERAVRKPSFYLPERLYAAPGLELNVYFTSIFDSVVPQNFAYQAYCKKGRSELRRWTFTPTAADAGTTFELVVNAWSDDGLAAAVTSTVEVAAAPRDPKRKVTLALLGDSLTNSMFQDQIYRDMIAAGFAGYTPVGLRQSELPGGVPHDGYGGFSFTTFLTRYTVSDEEVAHVQDAAEREQLKALGMPVKIIHSWQRGLLRSPLVKFENGRKSVDIPRWLGKINGGKEPDIVLVELGVNSVFDFRGEASALHKRIREGLMVEADRFFARLRQDMPNATYLLCTQPVGASQDGFAANYGASWNEVQHRKIIFALNREYDAYVKAKNDPKLRLLPVGHALDPVEGFIRAERPVSARSKRKVLMNVNAVHPSDVGGFQMGDAIAAMLQVLLK